MSRPKVFGIGFQKTGTSSLGLAFEELGYRTASYWQFRDFANDAGVTREKLWTRMREVMGASFDAGKDTPFPIFYRELDVEYPGSKFILVIRETEKWFQSALDDFGSHPNEIHRLIYGVPAPAGRRDVWVARYERHNREVQEYFAGRPADLLTLHLDEGEVGWAPICRFLNAETPDKPWPHANTKASKRKLMFWSKVRRKLGLPGKA